MTKPKIELVIAEAHKVDVNDSLIIFVDPQYADFCQDIFDEVRRITGHDHHTVLPVPPESVRIFRAERSITMSIDQNLMPVFEDPHTPRTKLEVNPKSHTYTEDKNGPST